MIGYLKGKIVAQHPGEVWVDVAGVGYRVRISDKSKVISLESEVELFIHTAVREDAITLYGFKTLDELELFEMLIGVSGVGPKTGMEIVGAAGQDQIIEAISLADINFFSRIKGIGKKSAQRIIIDLKNKIGSLKEIDLTAEDEEDMVFMALKQFGFKPSDISAVLKKIDRTKSEEEQIREGLRMLGKNTHG